MERGRNSQKVDHVGTEEEEIGAIRPVQRGDDVLAREVRGETPETDEDNFALEKRAGQKRKIATIGPRSTTRSHHEVGTPPT